MAYILNVQLVNISRVRVKECNLLRIFYKKRCNPVSKIAFQFLNNIKKKKDIIKSYIDKRHAFLNKTRHKIEQILHQEDEIIIYGAGMHTSQVLQSGILNGYKIKFIVDSDKRKEGTLFEGLTIRSPNDLRGTTAPVLISSYDSQKEISSYLTINFPHIRQIKLYDEVPT